jgi:hypothetical protein
MHNFELLEGRTILFDFKYLSYIEELSMDDCPPTSLSDATGRGYRFLLDDPESEENVLPAYLRNPTRFEGRSVPCEAFALSLFHTKEQALSRFRALESYIPNIRKKIGSCVGVIELHNTDGLVSLVNERGHFSLFEDKDAVLENRFTDIEAL